MTDTTGPVLADEPLERFQPLGVFGQPVHQSHIQLQAALKRRLGDRYANFFSTPHIDAQGERVSWRSPVAGDVRRWSDLSDEEQADRALDLQVMKSELEAYMSELRAFEGQGKDAKAATAFVAVLEQALKTPNDGYLFFVDDQPVSAFWGFREEEAAPFETLTAAPRVRPAAAASPAAAPPVQPSSKGLAFPWWWLLIPLLLLLLLFLIWWFWPEETPSVESLPDRPGVEEPVPDDRARPEEPDGTEVVRPDGVIVDRDGRVVPGTADENGEAVLVPDGEAIVEGDGEAIDEGAIVEDDSAEGAVDNDPAADADTPVEPETPLDQEVPEVPEGEDTTGQNDEAQQPTDEGEAAETPETPETPVPEPETQDPEQPSGEEGQTGATGDQPDAPAPNPGEAPDIPENAADGAAGFMQGDWQSDSGLVDGQSGGRLSQEFKFDENGQGETVVRKSNGVTCRAPAEATVRDGNLHVEEKSNLKCTDGSSFKRSKTVCIRGQDGQARCRGVDSDGKQFDVQMNRGAQP